jgi:DNA processing protein
MTDDNKLLLDIAFSMTRGATPRILERMDELSMSKAEFFDLPTPDLSRRLSLTARHIIRKEERDAAMARARVEMAFVNKNKIRVLALGNEDYPRRLLQCHDAPLAIYVLGNADLNESKAISLVGSRRATPIGTNFTKKIVGDLAAYGLKFNVVSGLAYGIDAAAHAAAIEYHQPTIAVVAHGLNTIYPSQHRNLAKAIIDNGGAIISEYPNGTRPFRANFLERNRIIAALSDVVIVVESEIKGGAMSTANQAFNYDRDVMAMPGRVTDPMSAGCNLLIRKNKASMVTAAADVAELMDWSPKGVKIDFSQRSLFPELSGDEESIYNLLKTSTDPMSLDDIHARLAIPMPSLLSIIGEMEFDGIVAKIPGNRVIPIL